jgi:hypothetical protein
MGKAAAIVRYSLLILFLATIALKGCSRSTCSEATDAAATAQYQFDAAINEVIHRASPEALDKEHRAYVKLDLAKEAVREACQSKVS